MKTSNPIHSVLPTLCYGMWLAAALALPHAASAQNAPAPYTLSPDKVEAGKAFTLSATSSRYSCNLIYYNQTVTVSPNPQAIYLTFQDSVGLRGVMCIVGSFGPSFNIPALKAGSYPVYISLIPTCPQGQICPLALPAPELAGTLTVSGSASVEPGSVTPFQGETVRMVLNGNRMELQLPKGMSAQWKPGKFDVAGKAVGEAILP